MVEQADNNKLSLKYLLEHGLNAAPQGPVRMSNNLASYVDQYLNDFPEDMSELEVPADCYEGATHQIMVNKYERSSIARMKCIEKYGCKCLVCGMDFEKTCGPVGKDFIHIHHLVPISTIGKKYKVNYEEDLIPICPNCHA